MTTEEVVTTAPADPPVGGADVAKQAARAAQGAEAEVQPEAPPQQQVFHVYVTTPHRSTVRLDQVNTGDTVASIRQLLQPAEL